MLGNTVSLLFSGKSGDMLVISAYFSDARFVLELAGAGIIASWDRFSGGNDFLRSIALFPALNDNDF